MAVIEIIAPPLKRDAESIAAFQKRWPSIVETFRNTADISKGIRGLISDSLGDSVKDAYSPVILFDWSSFSSYNAFFTSEEFNSFHTQISPLLHGPPRPQLFNTNIPLKELPQCRFLEILRFPTRGDLTSRQISWGKVMAGLEKYGHPGGSSITGVSLNLEEETFLGIIGWQSVTSYKTLHKNVDIAQAWEELVKDVAPWGLLLRMDLEPLEV